MDTLSHERLLQTLSAILIQVHALQTLVGNDLSTQTVVGAPFMAPSAVGTSFSASALAMVPHELRNGLCTIEHMTRDALSMVRSANENLTLPELEGVTLADALSRLVEETAETVGLSSRVSFSGIDEQGQSQEHTLSSATERVLFLIAREALYEVQQHTGARKVRLTLNYGQEDVHMSIEDDGLRVDVPLETLAELPLYDSSGPAAPPFHTEPLATAPGVVGTSVGAPFMAPSATASVLSIIHDLRGRIESLGGSLEISPLGEKGTRVLTRVPYAQHVHTTPHPPLPAPPVVGTTFMASTPVTVVRVLVVDNQSVTRAGLRRLVESYDGIQVVGEAADGIQAVSETQELGPHVVLMDTHLPNGQSMEALRQIKQLNLDTKVLLLSTQDREEYLYETLRAGADGYILKDIAPDELVQAIRAVARGEVQIQAQLAGRLLSRVGKQGRGIPPYESLTARELEVLRLLARGMRNKEIAARLYVSERTVNFHLANIYQKLNVSGRTEALSRALEQGLITA